MRRKGIWKIAHGPSGLFCGGLLLATVGAVGWPAWRDMVAIWTGSSYAMGLRWDGSVTGQSVDGITGYALSA